MARYARALLALPGIGPWTADYIALRALGDPDVFLPTDVGVRNAPPARPSTDVAAPTASVAAVALLRPDAPVVTLVTPTATTEDGVSDNDQERGGLTMWTVMDRHRSVTCGSSRATGAITAIEFSPFRGRRTAVRSASAATTTRCSARRSRQLRRTSPAT